MTPVVHAGAALTATCPLCHQPAPTITPEALLEGAAWSCSRCGQKWDATRLETAAVYQRSLGAK
jgi:transposase